MHSLLYILHFRVQLCARTHTHIGKLFFAFRRVFTIILSLPTTINPFLFSLHTHTRTHTTYSLQTHQNGAFFFSCYTRTVACERVFSIHFAATTITIRHHHIHSRRPYTKQSRASYTYMHDRCSVCVCFMFEKKARRKSKDIRTHVQIYIYIYIYVFIRIYVMCERFLSLSIPSLSQAASEEKTTHH